MIFTIYDYQEDNISRGHIQWDLNTVVYGMKTNWHETNQKKKNFEKPLLSLMTT
jgi:hypothetical protein